MNNERDEHEESIAVVTEVGDDVLGSMEPSTSTTMDTCQTFSVSQYSRRKDSKIDPEMIMPVPDFPYFIKKSDIEAGIKQASEDRVQVVFAASQDDDDDGISTSYAPGKRRAGPEVAHLCSICGRKFTTASMLREHEKIHRGEKPHVCSICNKSFSLPGGLVQHEKIHVDGRRFVCNICGKGFARKEVLKNHILSHTGEKPFPCELCGKCFSRKAILKRHEASHITDKYYQCNGCGKSFMDQSQITVKTNELVCSICGDQLTTVLFIKNKEEPIESEHRPFHCSFCGKGFKLFSNMKCHERIHLGQRPFKCSYCFKTFTTSSNLKVHERLHTGVKPYQCSICGKSFITTSNLKLHLKSHRTEQEVGGIFVEV
ncbi:zinc finger protein OZF-like isoform X2 [Artemia franciscana]